MYSADGEKLGKVAACDDESFTIEKGFFFPKDFISRYEYITAVNDDGIHLSLLKDELTGEGAGAERTKKPGIGERIEGKLKRGEAARAEGDEIRMPVTEEQLEVTKRDRDAGEVRLRKDVTTEHERVDVPVTKERVYVEHVPAERSAAPGEDDFERTSTSMPVREEELEVHKRPVVKEEVRLRKEREIERRAAEGDVRKEHASIEGDADVRESKRDDEHE